ncbi:helix-turn-helix transcriptional regulator [Mucilaginibacter psychrotolerans]|uniref:WYL domain-containing protein n=1 Tax=Mucilaginibacter psychrotolerans TaxID=1524096 RepID=A0A4Y8SK25_9SPHI|nr:WYL domain-containing protein [Mucilaginibacter psychrotolerans]TFF38766.1 WYL domain-containing protein [Mucilaginibacter psychrotolerans]
MSALHPILRHISLIQFLQSKRLGASLKQIGEYIAARMCIDGDKYLDRTFQRDKKAILDNYKVDIAYNPADKLYRIVNTPAEVGRQAMEAFELLNAVLQTEDFAGRVLFDHRRAQGMAHFQPLLNAIKKCVLVKFRYQKFDEEAYSQRLAEPYAMKEFKGRWYLMALDMADLQTKTFGLDRMSMLEITKKKFDYPESYNPQQLFENCFGITSPYHGQQPEELVLAFSQQQHRYVTSYPLHKSQRDIKGPNGEILTVLNICLNYDLEMELLSYGDQVKVLSPEHFAKRIKQRLKRAAEQ